jgi:hypothetical protein
MNKIEAGAVQADVAGKADSPTPEVVETRTDAGPGVLTGLASLPHDALLDKEALAGVLGCCAKSIERMVRRHELPPPVRFGGRGRWLAGAIMDHFKARADAAAKAQEREVARLRRLGP